MDDIRIEDHGPDRYRLTFLAGPFHNLVALSFQDLENCSRPGSTPPSSRPTAAACAPRRPWSHTRPPPPPRPTSTCQRTPRHSRPPPPSRPSASDRSQAERPGRPQARQVPAGVRSA
ncbi:hypothetical protein LI90_3452 [Carbonactinospora thermoautotrophica]|uniref:Uncharacterized protein n=1 Tax=Carbonactinospora thermoautotrophica TaxID=1469144 RepID=A0A132MX30_9ACTN|nr:hypothetical protein LI90_3452 [Carbonactinospora thermoautotrophica]